MKYIYTLMGIYRMSPPKMYTLTADDSIFTSFQVNIRNNG